MTEPKIAADLLLNPFPPKVTNVPGVGPLMLTTEGGIWILRGRSPWQSWEYVPPWDYRYLLRPPRNAI